MAYDYKDYYTPIRGQNEADKLGGNEVAPGQGVIDKLRAMFGMFGVDQTPVNLNNPNAGIGEKLRGGLGLAPALQPTATQADVRKSDNAMATPSMPNFGAVPAPPAPAQFAPVAPGASQSQVRASDNAIAANTPSQVVDGAWAAPHGASPGIGAQLEAGPATTAVSSSRDANGNLVLTNAPPGPAGPAGPGAAPQGYQARAGSLASFFGASMRMKQAATTDAAARATALKLPETMKTTEEAKKQTELNRLADAEKDPEKRRLILSGLQAPSAAPYTFIPGMNEGEVMVGNRQTGKATTEIAARAPTPLKEGQTGKARDAKGNMVPVVIRNGVPVPI